jgi:subtilisin family serine protease
MFRPSDASDARPSHTDARPAVLESLELRLFWSTTVNDRYFGEQYALTAINADDAWDVSTGSAAVVVANNDTGIDLAHDDLYLNVWVNQGEIPAAMKKKLKDTDGDGILSMYDLNASANKGVVTDGNRNGRIDGVDLLQRFNASTATGGFEDNTDADASGYRDDIVGWDFAEDDNDPTDRDGHGTATAGVIGAIGNNGKGVAGVNWKVSILSAKIFDDGGDAAPDSVIAKAIRYSAKLGVRVSNNSWGGTAGSNGDVLHQAISYAGSRGQVFVTSAGNDGVNNDTSRFRNFPSSYNLANIISVAATGRSGRLANYSNFGSSTVDVAAPGSGVYSTGLGNTYDELSGTSFASPYVAGSVALLLSTTKSLSVAQIKARLIDGADETTSLYNSNASHGLFQTDNVLTHTAGATVDETTVPVNGARPGYRRPVVYIFSLSSAQSSDPIFFG